MYVKLVGCNSDFDTPDSQESPEGLCAAYGRISRSTKSIAELRLDAAKDINKARQSNSKIVFDYGHSSIAEHAILNFDISGISRLAVEALEAHRLVSFTEKSQRYVDFSDTSVYDIDAEVESFVLGVEYDTHIEACFSLYKKLLNAGVPGEDARYVLPLATTTDIGMTINARNLELVIHRLISTGLREAQILGWDLYREALEVVPSLVKFRLTGITSYKNKDMLEFLNNEYGDIKNTTQALTDMLVDVNFKDTNVALTEFTVDPDSIIADAHSMEIQGVPLFAGCDSILKEFYRILFRDMHAYSVPPRAFETANFYFIAQLSASAFAQLKRHRMCTILPSPYWVNVADTHQFIIPDSIALTRPTLFHEFYSLCKKTSQLYNRWLEKFDEFPSMCNYLLLNAHTRFVQISMNMRSLYNFSRLRCDSHAQTEIRHLAKHMVNQVQEEAPLSGCMLGGKSDFKTIKLDAAAMLGE